MLIIGIAGGAGSGKTSVVRQITEHFKNDQIVVIPQDSYYKDSSSLPLEERRKLNFDHPDSIDFELLIEHIRELREGRSIREPVYSYVSCTRSDTETVTVSPAHIMIVEGILVFCEKRLRDLMDIRVFVDTDPDDRLLRLISRDTGERGKTLDEIMGRYVRTVKPMHLQFIEPSKRYADLIIPEGGHNKVAIDILISTIERKLQNKEREQ